MNIVPKWRIINHSNYFISDKNKIYNWTTGKELKTQLKGYTKGYYLSGKFYSLNQLRKLLVKIERSSCPF